MGKSSFAAISNQVEMLSYDERILLLDRIVKTLHVSAPSAKINDGADFKAAFGLWKNKNISVETIRAKAWGRS